MNLIPTHLRGSCVQQGPPIGEGAMNILIPNYEILNFEAESLVVSDTGVSKIYSQSLLDVLRQLQLHTVMTKTELDEILAEKGLVVSGAFEFLEKIMPLRPVEDMYFDKVVIVHDWVGRVDLEGVVRSELSGLLEFKNLSCDLATSIRDVKCFIVFVCQSYNYDRIRSVYFDVVDASPKSAISVCWRMGGVFCVGQPYIAEIASPCHFCTIDRLVNNESAMPAKGNWASVLGFCKSKHLDVPEKPLSYYQEILVIGAVIRMIKFFTEHDGGRKFQDDVLSASYLQLSDGKISESSVSHWYMCDCLGVGR